MAQHGKKYRAAIEKVERRPYQLDEAMRLLKEIAYAKFNETVELSMLLGVDPKHADQMVRGTTVLPHGTGQSKRVLVIAAGEKQKEAQEAGADMVGGDDMVAKIQEGWIDFDAVIATPDMMRSVGKLGKVLGPRGLMPNPKTGTVTFDVAKAIQEIKAGKVEFRVDKTSIIDVPVGKISFTADQLRDNATSIIQAVEQSRLALLTKSFTCETAVVFTSTGGVILAKTLTTFSEDVPAVQCKAALLAGQVVPPNQIQTIANLPSRDALLAKVLFLMQHP